MERKYQIIYIWSFIIVSAVVLILLYTPMGGNLHKAAYGEQYRYTVAPGVNYQTQVGAFNGAYNGSGGSNTEAYVSENFKHNMIGENSTITGGSNGVSLGNGFGSGGGAVATTKSSKGSGSNGGGFGGMTLAMGGGGSSAASSGGGGGGGMPFSSSNSGSVMQRATDGTTADDGNADPGGEENMGDPLPLKDDLIVLAIISLIYAFYRFRNK